ncbi:OmpP1/FadL family transporter [Burkholderia sp. IMCC1007]|uniref:OmpP1/FadL family transporter n=1 Tax=Burkholderia sp. IMCC1007 TaxID=3004104 RepID=UPI0022B49539|nr:outer membrane protein transport protein [Burkholderia sp. IMCC1007]
MNRPFTKNAVLLALSGIANVSIASVGIYPTGYGTQAQGMGGAGIAVGESALAPAGNPAGIAFSGDRLDVGTGLFITNDGAQQDGKSYPAKTGIAPLPEFGYVKALSPSFVVGVASWAAGAAVNYGYPYGEIPGNSKTYSQAIFAHVAPTIAYRFGANGDNAIAISAVGAMSTISVGGIEAQTGLPNQGRDWKPGYGIKVGWLSRLTPQVSVGAFYASKIYYQPWSKYSHIFADGGRFQEPEQYGAGIALRPTQKLLLAFDWIRFNFRNTRGLGNPLNFSAAPGAINGSGTGFANINAYRFGVQYAMTDRLTLRAGFEMANQLLTSDNTALTFIIPATVNRTYTIGATYHFANKSDLSLAYGVSPRVQVNGTGMSAGTNPYMRVNFISVGYSRKF